jgi:hypothetical protein
MKNIKSIASVVKESKRFIEIVEYEYPLTRMTYTSKTTKPIIRAPRTESKDYHKNRVANKRKALKTVRQLIECNFEKKYSFVTLTFKEPITDIAEANHYLKRFLERLRYQLKKLKHGPLKYIQVAEIQKKRVDNPIHFHLVTNLTKKSDIQLLRQQWSENGFSNADCYECNHENNSIITRYLLKQAYDERLKGNLYKTSRGLEQPVIKEFETYGEAFETLDDIPVDCVHTEEFEIPVLGRRKVTQYYRKEALN